MANLEIIERRLEKVIVLDLNGQLRLGETNVRLHDKIRSLAEEGHSQIIVNLEGVSYIDSTGLGELISSHVSVGKNGGEIKLLHLTTRVRELMTLTKLLTVFDVFDSEQAAIESFSQPALKHAGIY